MLILIYSSGLRVSEVINLTVHDIFRTKSRLRVRQGKGNKDRYTILSDLAVKYLEKYWIAYKPINWLFDTVKETLLTTAGEEKYFGANIGFFSILHTWGQKLNQHYHLHCAVPGGGYSEKKQKWLSCPQDYFKPVLLNRE